MKIDGTRPPGSSGDIPRKKSAKTPGGGESFKSVLNEVSRGQTEKPGAVQPPPPVVPPRSVGRVGGAVETRAVERLDTALADLELYRNALANADIPKSRLSDMADLLAERKDELVSLLPHVSDPEVRDLITGTAALIIDENTRYHAG